MATDLDEELGDKQLKKLRRFAYPSCMPKRTIPKRFCPRSKITILMIIASIFCLLGCLIFSVFLFYKTPSTIIAMDLWITIFVSNSTSGVLGKNFSQYSIASRVSVQHMVIHLDNRSSYDID